MWKVLITVEVSQPYNDATYPTNQIKSNQVILGLGYWNDCQKYVERQRILTAPLLSVFKCLLSFDSKLMINEYNVPDDLYATQILVLPD